MLPKKLISSLLKIIYKNIKIVQQFRYGVVHILRCSRGGGGGMGFAIIATKGEGGSWGLQRCTPLIRLDFDFDKTHRLVVTVITF